MGQAVSFSDARAEKPATRGDVDALGGYMRDHVKTNKSRFDRIDRDIEAMKNGIARLEHNQLRIMERLGIDPDC